MRGIRADDWADLLAEGTYLLDDAAHVDIPAGERFLGYLPAVHGRVCVGAIICDGFHIGHEFAALDSRVRQRDVVAARDARLAWQEALDDTAASGVAAHRNPITGEQAAGLTGGDIAHRTGRTITTGRIRAA